MFQCCWLSGFVTPLRSALLFNRCGIPYPKLRPGFMNHPTIRAGIHKARMPSLELEFGVGAICSKVREKEAFRVVFLDTNGSKP